MDILQHCNEVSSKASYCRGNNDYNVDGFYCKVLVAYCNVIRGKLNKLYESFSFY
jgi:hypothetical protein